MSWNEFFKQEEKEYYIKLNEFLDNEYRNNICYPKKELIYNAFNLTKYEDVKVVILGQDPYHEPNQAHGLAFSVLCEKLPPSLKNIYKEMESDLNININQDGNLEYLARQGVLLLNTILTVRKGEAASHQNKGWEIFSDNVLSYLNKRNTPMVFILWGNYAKKKIPLINNPKHFIITSAHPSPLSCYNGFFGSKPFSKTNEFLKSNLMGEINWVKREHLTLFDI